MKWPAVAPEKYGERSDWQPGGALGSSPPLPLTGRAFASGRTFPKSPEVLTRPVLHVQQAGDKGFMSRSRHRDNVSQSALAL